MFVFNARTACCALSLAATAPLLAGCDEPNVAVAAAQPAEPDVTVVTVKPQARAMVRELPGRISPTRVSEVRPRVSGIVVQRLFSQGSEVRAGGGRVGRRVPEGDERRSGPIPHRGSQDIVAEQVAEPAVALVGKP